MEALTANTSKELDNATNDLINAILDVLLLLLLFAAIATAIITGGGSLVFAFGICASLVEGLSLAFNGGLRANGILGIKALRTYSGVGILEILEANKTNFTISPGSN